MACSKYNIKVVEHNDFTLLFPLKKRTYVASLPIDEDIVIEDLEHVKVTIGGVEFASTLDERGVMVAVAYDALERGTYDIIITAEYHGAQIRAAYFEGLTIVNWNMQSDAEQYLPGSPIVMQAAFVIGGPLTDAELEALKQQYREAIAAAQQAQADAEQAKEDWEQKAQQLDDVAQQTTLTQGVADIRDDISHINIDTSELAKETSVKDGNDTAIGMLKDQTNGLAAIKTQAANAASDAASVKTLVGTPASGQPSDLFAAIAAGGGGGATPQEVAQAVIEQANVQFSYGGVAYQYPYEGKSPLQAALYSDNMLSIIDDEIEEWNTFPAKFANLEEITMTKVYRTYPSATMIIRQLPKIKKISIPKWQNGRHTQFSQTQGTLEELSIPFFDNLGGTPFNEFVGDVNLIKIETGSRINVSCNFFASWSPTNALMSNSSSLVHDGETFASNLEKLLYNIRTFFAANLPDRTGLPSLTMTFSAEVKAAVQADTATSNAFTNKNWTIA